MPCAECHEIWEPKPPATPWATPGLLRDSFITVFNKLGVFLACRRKQSWLPKRGVSLKKKAGQSPKKDDYYAKLNHPGISQGLTLKAVLVHGISSHVCTYLKWA
jgi:hypothetical protein